MGPDAKVSTVAERQVVIVCATDIERVGIGEMFRIAIGGREHGENEIALPNPLRTKFDVFHGDPSEILHRTVETQELFDGPRYEAGIVAEPLHLLRILQ